MKVKQEYIVCDVCERKVYGDLWQEITFQRNGKEFAFDACSDHCLTNSGIRGVYKKICDTIKGLKD